MKSNRTSRSTNKALKDFDPRRSRSTSTNRSTSLASSHSRSRSQPRDASGKRSCSRSQSASRSPSPSRSASLSPSPSARARAQKRGDRKSKRATARSRSPILVASHSRSRSRTPRASRRVHGKSGTAKQSSTRASTWQPKSHRPKVTPSAPAATSSAASASAPASSASTAAASASSATSPGAPSRVAAPPAATSRAPQRRVLTSRGGNINVRLGAFGAHRPPPVHPRQQRGLTQQERAWRAAPQHAPNAAPAPRAPNGSPATLPHSLTRASHVLPHHHVQNTQHTGPVLGIPEAHRGYPGPFQVNSNRSEMWRAAVNHLNHCDAATDCDYRIFMCVQALKCDLRERTERFNQRMQRLEARLSSTGASRGQRPHLQPI